MVVLQLFKIVAATNLGGDSFSRFQRLGILNIVASLVFQLAIDIDIGVINHHQQ